MKFFALALIVLQLAACAAAPAPLREDFKRDRVQMIASVYPLEQITYICAGLRRDGLEKNAGGCARYSNADNVCEIFIPEPRHVDDREIFAYIGHETWHCLRGSFH